MTLERSSIALVVVLLCAPLHAAETELEPRIWIPDLGGSVRVAEGGTGTEITLPETLGFSEEEANEIRLTHRTAGAFVVRFGYVPLSYGGNANLADNIDFNGISFPVSLDVTSDLEIEYGRIGVGMLFRASENFRIGPIVELKAMRIEAALAGSVLGVPLVSARETTEGGFASAGLGFDAKPLPKLHLTGEVGYSPGLDYGEMIEAEMGVKFRPVKLVSVFGGYRLIDLDLEVDDDTADLELSGPYLGASLTF